MKKIYVGNLPWSVKDADLQAKFSEFGNVLSARIVTDNFTEKSRGFGFVEMEDADAEKAITALNGQKWGDRDMTVNEARPKTDRGGDRGDRPERRNFSRF